MIFQGEFKNRENTKTYKVRIGNSGTIKNILDPLDRSFKYNRDTIMFAEDPVVITCERDELQQQILIRQATINLKANYDLSSYLFADTTRSIPVMIDQKVGNDWVGVFHGYVDPLQFNQGIAYNFESYTVHATDPLGALEDLKINSLNNIRRTDTPSIKALFEDIFDSIGCELDLSQWVNSPNSVSDDLVTNMSVFYGDNEDDYMTLYETLVNLLRYQGSICYYNPVNDTARLMNMYVSDSTNVDFNLFNNAMDKSSNMSMSDVYSQIKLKCNIEPVEDIDLLAKDELVPLHARYTKEQKYMTELVCPGEGENAYNGFVDYLNSQDGWERSGYENAYMIEHFCQMLKNDAWDFGANGYTSLAVKEDQSDYLIWLKEHPTKAMFVSLGYGNKITKKDDSPTANVNMTDYLIINVDGHSEKYPSTHHTNIMNQFNNNKPICKYNGLQNYNLTPSDMTITNYIVFSGKFILNPIQQKTGSDWYGDTDNTYRRSKNTFKNAKTYFNPPYSNNFVYRSAHSWHHTVPNDSNGDGAYYTQKWWSCTTPSYNNPLYTLKNGGDSQGISPFLNINKNKDIEFTEAHWNNNSDTVSKLPILVCQLKIGDKYCVERLDMNIVNKFEWRTREYLESHNIAPYFTLGINPAIDDYIIGQQKEISNNITSGMNLGVSGMAIPVRVTDELSGVPEFSIIGVSDITWLDDFKAFGFIPLPQLPPTTILVLEKIETIMIESLKIQFVSNEAGYNDRSLTTADNDLVYCSDMMPMYIEDREDDLCICTPLTMDECLNYGIKYEISDSYIYHSDASPFLGWTYNNDTETVKPEQMWVDYMYKQCSQPHKILTTAVRDTLFVDEQSSLVDIGRWMSQGTISGTIGTQSSNFNKGYITRMEWDLKDRTIDLDVREAAEYAPVWENE